MAKGKTQQSSLAKELVAKIKEVKTAKSKGREIHPSWDLDGLLAPIKMEYALDRFHLPADTYDRIFGALELILLQALFGFIEEKLESDTSRGKVPIRGMVLFWGCNFVTISGVRGHPSLKKIVEYLFSKKAMVTLNNGEKVTPLDGFITKEVMPFLNLRFDSTKEGFAEIRKKYSKMIQECFEGVLPVGQEYSLYFAQDAIARIIIKSNPQLFSEKARKSIPAERKPLEKVIDEKTLPANPAPSAATAPAAFVKDEIRADGIENKEPRQFELTSPKITTHPLDLSNEDYLRKFLGSCATNLPSAYYRDFPITFFVERTLLKEEPSGRAENIPVAELPMKMNGKSGVIIGEGGIGITSIINKMILSRNTSRKDGEHVLICLSAEDIRPSANTQHHLEDAVFNTIKRHLPGNPAKAMALQEYIALLDKLGSVTYIIDNADKLDGETLGSLTVDLNQRESVFYSARAWQAERILGSLKNKPGCKITAPEWTSGESDELINKLIALLPDGSFDRQSYELRMREFPELKRHPLGILACFEQTIRNDNVIPVVIHQWITELALRSGLPAPDLLTAGDISENDDYYMAIGRALIVMINRNKLGEKAAVDYDLPWVEIGEQVIRDCLQETKKEPRLEIREKVKRRFLAPSVSIAGFRLPNLCFSIFLGGLARAHRTIEYSDHYKELLNQESTNLGRIRMMEESIWELRMKDYTNAFRITNPP